MENRHFFFKYREGNKGFSELLKSPSYDAMKIPLPIYFGEWMSKDYYNNSEEHDWRKNYQQRPQVDLFFRIKDNQEDDYYFWIFLPDEIYTIRLLKPLNIIDWQAVIPEDHYVYDKNGSTPKYYLGILEKNFYKMILPEAFANINTNQKYNRKTIIEFEGNEELVANHLVCSSEKMKISATERLSLLSPVQFETLIFLIFVQYNVYCSTYRGGTKEKYDLLIDNKEEVFPEFENGIINIQIKMKKDFVPPKLETKTVFVYLGKTDKKKNLFGNDWIFSKIGKSKYIDNWLTRSLDFFEIID